MRYSEPLLGQEIMMAYGSKCIQQKYTLFQDGKPWSTSNYIRNLKREADEQIDVFGDIIFSQTIRENTRKESREIWMRCANFDIEEKNWGKEEKGWIKFNIDKTKKN